MKEVSFVQGRPIMKEGASLQGRLTIEVESLYRGG